MEQPGASISAPEFETVWEEARAKGFEPKMLSKEQLRDYCDLGFCIVDEGCPPAMLEPLREATARVIAKSRALEWPNPRWCRRQDGGPIEGRPNSDDIWGASDLLHPALAEPIFLQARHTHSHPTQLPILALQVLLASAVYGYQ